MLDLQTMSAGARLIPLVILVVGCSYSPPGDDDDPDGPPTIGFEFGSSGADEQAATVTIPVVLSRTIEDDVSIRYAVRGGTASPVEDFEIRSSTLTIAAGDERGFIPIEIIADTDETEAVETIELELSMPRGAVLDPGRSVHTVEIADRILPRVVFNAVSTSSSEATPSQLLIKLTAPSQGRSSVVLGVTGGSPAPASADDHGLTDGMVIEFVDQQTMVMVPIGEVDDALDEEDSETVVLSLRGASTNLVLGNLTTTTHAILDNDDPPVVGFAMATGSVAENVGGGSVTVEVRLSAPSGRTVSVGYARNTSDTATAQDATVVGSPGVLTFAPGEVSKTITVQIINDALDEDDEVVGITLSNPSNATLGTASHALTIVDDDPPPSVAFVNATSRVDEDIDETATIQVRLSAASGKTVTVPFVLNAATTATLNADFTIATVSPLVFDPGITQRTITIVIIRNLPTNEPDELVVLDLVNPVNATLGTPAQHRLTIEE
jgi:hypothetical protein